MAQSTEPVFFCDPHQRDGKRIIGDRFTIHIDGPDGPETWTVDLCSAMEWGPKQGHDAPIRQLRDFLAANGEKVIGAELILPGDRKVIPAAKEEAPSLEPPKAEEEPERVPTAPLFHPGLESRPQAPRPEGKPPIPDPGFSAPPSSEPITEEEEYPESLYELIITWTKDRGISLSRFAVMLGVHSQTIYNLKRTPPNPARAEDVLKAMGFSGEALHRLILKYAGREPKGVPADPTPGLEEVIDRTIDSHPRTPKPVDQNDRRAGLNSAAIYGQGKTYGVNPRASTLA